MSQPSSLQMEINEQNAQIPNLSAFIVCKNEEHTIQRCIESVSFASEVIVIDSYSTDRTPEICKALGVKFEQRAWKGYLDQKRYACSQASNEWVLFIDADEVVSSKLEQEIRAIFDSTDDMLSGYDMPRVVYFLDRWWDKSGWRDERRLRLFRKDRVRWVGREPHENVEVDGEVGSLSGPIHHYSYVDFKDQVARLSSHAYARAQSDYTDGRTVSIIDFVAKPLIRFFKFYVLKLGFREGVAGFLIGVHEAYYTFLKSAYLWEMNRNSKRGE